MKTSSNKILTIAVILLLLVNVAMLVFLLKGRRHHYGDKKPGKGGPVEYMAKELGMTEEQKNTFRDLREAHFKVVKPLFDSITVIRKTFFDLVRDANANDSAITDFSNRIAAVQLEIDKQTLAHFRQARSLFQGQQREKYDSLVQKIMQRKMAGPGNRWGDSSVRKD
ncbi:MAG: periplasmic heavy metal sensor [Sphingobacteriales bacterium]|nr:periplasmic heavy metal sensor [Sphingobacteriales bacterium]